MPEALIRLEDVGPGGYYETQRSQLKLLVITDYLFKLRVPFHVAVISRYIDPSLGVDRSIADADDPVSIGFVRTLQAMAARGASFGMHGYTHQYGRSVSGEGYEFAYSGCKHDCPPDDSPEALASENGLRSSYAFSRFYSAWSAFRAAGLRPDWFEAPHYTASEVQRRILEACSWLMYENNPDQPDSRQVTFRSSGSRIGKTFYVPTPLGYVSGEHVEQDVHRILFEADSLAGDELASFFYHPFLEFPYIHISPHAPPYYEEGSPLKTLIRHMLSDNRRFVSILELIYGC